METKIPQCSGPTEHVADEVVYKERGDSLVRADTTASSLEVEQDSSNIDKTQSKATLNEPSSLGTSSGSGLKRQETIGDIIAQTRFKNVSKQSYDPLLARVLDLEQIKTTQAEEIVSLKRRVKKLEHKKRSRTYGLKRLYKVGSSRRVESSNEKGLGEEDASKQGRIHDIDADAGITLVSTHFDADTDMFGTHDLVGDEVVVESEVVVKAGEKRNVVEEVVAKIDAASTISVSVANTILVSAATTITTKEITLAKALANLKSTKPKAKGIVFKEPGESTTTTLIPSKIQDKGKGKMVEPEPVKKLSKKDQLKLDEEIALKLQAKIDEEERLARGKAQQIKKVNIAWDDVHAKVEADYQLAQRLQVQEQEELTDEEKAILFIQLLEQRRKHFTAKRSGEELEQESVKKQKVDEDKETIELQSLIEVIPDEEEVAIDAIPLATKPLTIVDWKIHKEEKKSYY
ncbi:hypothetical protein Tco_0290010 [Tanacetum coccineum]